MKSQNVFLSLGLAFALTAVTACEKVEDRPYKVQLVCKTNDKVTMRSEEFGYIWPPNSDKSDTYKFHRTYDDRYSVPVGRYRQRMGEYCVIYRVYPKPSNF